MFINGVKDFKILEVVVANGSPEGESKLIGKVTFRYEDSPAEAELSVDGVNWLSVSMMHQAMATFIDRHPLAFAELPEQGG